jgi:hypothetical protein
MEKRKMRREKFGQHRLSLRIDGKRRRRVVLLRERSKRDPPCMLSKWHSCKREAHLKGGGTMREGNSH